jgi:hypothetical protein
MRIEALDQKVNWSLLTLKDESYYVGCELVNCKVAWMQLFSACGSTSAAG